VRPPFRVTYFGYTCRVTLINENMISIAVLELPYNVTQVPNNLKNKVYYYLQFEGFIEDNIELF